MDSSTSKLSRRTLFAGASATGAIAAVATLMPAAKPADVAAPDTPKQPPEHRKVSKRGRIPTVITGRHALCHKAGTKVSKRVVPRK